MFAVSQRYPVPFAALARCDVVPGGLLQSSSHWCLRKSVNSIDSGTNILVT